MINRIIDKNKYYFWILLFSIFLLGFFVREIKLYEVPRLGATFDEFAWTWLGMNLIQTGIPISWSPHSQYEDAQILMHNGAYFRLVTPYLEHPPFFGLVAGSFVLISGVNNILMVQLYHFRQLSLMLGMISIALVYYLSKQLYGRYVGFLSALLYSIIPTVVIGSRLLQNENFFIPLWLAGLFFVLKSLQSQQRIFVTLAAILAFLLVISKIPFMAGGISFFALYLFYKKYKYAITILLAIIFGFLAFYIYGSFYDRALLHELLLFQTQRYDLTYNSIFSLFEKPYLADRFFTDGWILWGFIAFFILLIKDYKKHIFVIIPFLTYFGIYMAGIPDEPGHGWYRYPFYPFLIIAISLFVKEYFNKNYLLTFMFVVFIGASLLQNVVQPIIGFSFIVFRAVIMLWALILLPIFFNNSVARFISKFLGYSFFIAYLIMSIILTIKFVD